MNTLIVYYQPFLRTQSGKVFYQDDKDATCEVTFRLNDKDNFQKMLEDYNINKIEVFNSEMAKPFVNWVKNNVEPTINFSLR